MKHLLSTKGDSPADRTALRPNRPGAPLHASAIPALLARVAEEAYEGRKWWMDETPPAILTVLTNGTWFYVVAGDDDALATGEAYLVRIEALPLLLQSPAVLRDALAAAIPKD